MLPPAAATTRVTAATMPEPVGAVHAEHVRLPRRVRVRLRARTSRTVTSRSPAQRRERRLDLGGDRARRRSASSRSDRAAGSWWSRSRLAPTPARASETSAMMPGRSGPMTVMASSFTRLILKLIAVMTLADSVIPWYDANARDLPWRVPGTSAWAVLVSEVMLQQTPVVRVTPAWHAWMSRWPDARRAGRGPARPRRSGCGTGSAIRAGRCGCTRARWPSWSGTAGRCPTTSTSCSRCPASGCTRPGRWRPSRTGSVTRSWTRTSAGWCPGPWRASRTPARPPPRADLAAMAELLPLETSRGGPGEHRVHGARRDRLHRPLAAL